MSLLMRVKEESERAGLKLNINNRFQQYMSCELPDVPAGFRKGRGARDQIANILGSLKKQEFQKSIYLCLIDYFKV